MGDVVIQSYEPLPELDGRDGVLLCDADLASELVRQRRAEVLNPHAEAFRYCPGSRAYEAMRASRGQPGPVLVDHHELVALAKKAPRKRKAVA